MAMAITASKLKSGSVIKWNNTLYKVLETEFRGTGKSAKMVQTKLRDIAKSNNLEHRFDADEKVEEADLDKKDLQYSYNDGGVYYFMDPVSFEQVPVDAEVLGSAAPFLKEETLIQVELYNEKVVSVVLPEFLELKVTTAPSPLRGDGGNSAFKEVTLENGVSILAPQFIKEGDRIRVDWAHKKYVDRVKEEKTK
jgi:elongation factor P